MTTISTANLLAALCEMRTAAVSPAPAGGWIEEDEVPNVWPYVELSVDFDDVVVGDATVVETVHADTSQEGRAIADRIVAALLNRAHNVAGKVTLKAHLLESGPRRRRTPGRYAFEIVWRVPFLWR